MSKYFRAGYYVGALIGIAAYMVSDIVLNKTLLKSKQIKFNTRKGDDINPVVLRLAGINRFGEENHSIQIGLDRDEIDQLIRVLTNNIREENK